jgi:hypothetical protein
MSDISATVDLLLAYISTKTQSMVLMGDGLGELGRRVRAVCPLPFQITVCCQVEAKAPLYLSNILQGQVVVVPDAILDHSMQGDLCFWSEAAVSTVLTHLSLAQAAQMIAATTLQTAIVDVGSINCSDWLETAFKAVACTGAGTRFVCVK